MAKTSAGTIPDELIPSRIPVIELCRVARCTPSNYYTLARRGKAPKPKRGITLAEAKSWLEGRAAKKAARAEALKQLRELCGEVEK